MQTPQALNHGASWKRLEEKRKYILSGVDMMEKEKIIHRVRDQYGEIEVIDRGEERILSFGGQTRQSVMPRNREQTLSLPYTQAMMTALLFQPQPQKALFLGLGGGTMPSFLLHHCPECLVDCVELRKEVVRAAQTYFNLAVDNPRLHTHIGDAMHFLANNSTADYDLIFSDLFSESGPESYTQEQSFLVACRNNLSPHGILTCNTWTVTQANFPTLARMSHRIFSNRILTLKLGARYNAIIFAFMDPQMFSDLRKKRRAAEYLRQKTTINFPTFLRQLIGQNVSLLDRLLQRV
jgi:spermidine synthase